MKKLVFVLSFVLISFSFTANGQSGFLGSTINLNAGFQVAPMLKNIRYNSSYTAYNKTVELDTVLNRVYYKKAAIRYRYTFGLNKVVSDKIQLGINYGYQKITMAGEQVIYIDSLNYGSYKSNGRMVTDIPITNNSFTFRFKYFYSGLAPIGRFWGIDLTYSIAKTDETIQYEYVNTLSAYTNSLFKTNSFNIESPTKIFKDTLNFGSKIKTFSFKLTYGRTIPISEKLGLDLSMIISLLNVQYYDFYPHFRRASVTSLNVDSEIFYKKRSFNQMVSRQLRNSQGFMFNIGIKYFI